MHWLIDCIVNHWIHTEIFNYIIIFVAHFLLFQNASFYQTLEAFSLLSRSFSSKRKYLLKLSWWNNCCFSLYRGKGFLFWRNCDENMHKSWKFCCATIFKNNLPKIYKLKNVKNAMARSFRNEAYKNSMPSKKWKIG